MSHGADPLAQFSSKLIPDINTHGITTGFKGRGGVDIRRIYDKSTTFHKSPPTTFDEFTDFIKDSSVAGGMMGNFEYPYNPQKMYDTKNSYLEKKSKLEFYFPQSFGKSWIITLPFYENPTIQENKSARYSTHNVVGRSSGLHTYVGSDSRKFNLSFDLTLPHLLQFYKGDLESAGGQTQEENLEKKRQKFKNQSSIVTANSAGNTTAATELRPRSSNYDSFFEIEPLKAAVAISQGKIPGKGGAIGPASPTNIESAEHGIPYSLAGLAYQRNVAMGTAGDVTPGYKKQVNNILDILAYWVDIIRLSCYNNTDNPIFGPPVIRLTHGMLFRKIPCIATSYDVAYDGNAGFHKNTMIPRKIQVRMELTEMRAGDFGKFIATDTVGIEGENLAGYEVLFEGAGSLGGSPDVIPLHGL